MNNIVEFYREHWRADGYGTDVSDEFQIEIFRSMFPGYEDKVRTHVDDFDRVLDAGCGDGTAALAFFGEVWHRIEYTGLEPSGISPAYDNFTMHGKKQNIRLLDRSILANKFDDGHFNWVFCVGVLHYLDDMQAGLIELTRVLKPGGRMVLWVYKKQPPIREMTDQYLRSYFSAMSPENARKAIEGLTRLGMELGGIKSKLYIENIPELGIEAGEYTVQKFFYYYIMKLFYHSNLPFERHVTNNWNAFYPSPVTFTEPRQFRTMLAALQLEPETFNTKGNGIAVIARKAS